MLGSKRNKKGQVGETLTWIVATLIIISVLFIFIYASIAMAKVKSVGSGEIKSKAQETIGKEVDWIETKNEMAFARDSSDRVRIERWLNEKQEN